ncbi:hypothetical protein SKAU_G00159730 [Synaphobranchus kaupii]|uniref:Uncharacterized protein n=1 Tax=Synaphobranchus kaupii TaxID=118154 RepID=A0A9Q1IZA4_SYNKA|nr:hypothetical protein SKAU_G00159730 [Synaphobranchus kaupii]
MSTKLQRTSLVLWQPLRTTHHLQNTAVSGGILEDPRCRSWKNSSWRTWGTSLIHINLSNWPEAFQVATRWAKKKFGRRLHLTTLDIAEKTFTPILTPRSTTSGVSTSNRFSVLADTPPPPPTTWRTTVTPPQDQDQYQREWPALRQTYLPVARYRHGTLRGRFCLRKHHTTRETGQAMGSQDTTGTGNWYHCCNDP